MRLIIAILLILFTIWWVIDSIRYDEDLEADHVKETGKYWSE